MKVLPELLRMASGGDDEPSAMEVLSRTPLHQLEDAVIALKNRHTVAEVRKAMVEVIARAPIADFDKLKHIYLKHCGSAAN
jgi:CBS domain-containing protein